PPQYRCPGDQAHSAGADAVRSRRRGLGRGDADHLPLVGVLGRAGCDDDVGALASGVPFAGPLLHGHRRGLALLRRRRPGAAAAGVAARPGRAGRDRSARVRIRARDDAAGPAGRAVVARRQPRCGGRRRGAGRCGRRGRPARAAPRARSWPASRAGLSAGGVSAWGANTCGPERLRRTVRPQRRRPRRIMGQLVLRVIAVVAAVLGAPVYVLGIGLVEMEIQRIRNQVVEDAVAAGSSGAQTSLPWVLTLLIVLLTAVVVAVFLPLPGRRRQADFRLPRYAFTAALTATVAIGVPTAVPTFWDELPAFLQPGPEALPNPALVWWYLATAGSRAPVALLGVMVTICLFDVY